MKRLLPSLNSLAVLLLIASALSGVARAADLSEPILLVASPDLDGSPFEQTVVLATPLPDGGHIGFILNKPTGVKMRTLFPDDAAASKVQESVYLGGPQLLPGVFAVTRIPPDGARAAVPLMPGVFAVIDKDAIDHIIETSPNDARYFVGMMVWKADDLETEVREEKWQVRPADADTVLRAKSVGLWRSLRGTAGYV